MSPRNRAHKNPSALRMVGRLLAHFREAAGLTQAQLAQRLVIGEAHLAAIEQGRRPLLPDLAELLDQILDTKGALAVAVDNLPEIDQFPLWAEKYIDQEQKAIALCKYDALVIPGLLQTPDYARALLQQRVPAYDEDEIATKMAARIERQGIFQRKDPPTGSFIIWEPALRMAFVEPHVRTEQLRHLRTMADLPGVTIQILPLDAEENAGAAGPFTLLETRDHQHLAYMETQRGSMWVSDPEEVSILARKYAMLRSQAVNPKGTKGLLDHMLGER